MVKAWKKVGKDKWKNIKTKKVITIDEFIPFGSLGLDIDYTVWLKKGSRRLAKIGRRRTKVQAFRLAKSYMRRHP